MHIFLGLFMLKDHQKPHIGTRYKGNLISFFLQFVNYFCDNWYTETDTLLRNY